MFRINPMWVTLSIYGIEWVPFVNIWFQIYYSPFVFGLFTHQRSTLLTYVQLCYEMLGTL